MELEKPDGSRETLPSGAASSLKLETYTVTFVADGSEVAVRQTVPGTPVDVTGITPEKKDTYLPPGIRMRPVQKRIPSLTV